MVIQMSQIYEKIVYHKWFKQHKRKNLVAEDVQGLYPKISRELTQFSLLNKRKMAHKFTVKGPGYTKNLSVIELHTQFINFKFQKLEVIVKSLLIKCMHELFKTGDLSRSY